MFLKLGKHGISIHDLNGCRPREGIAIVRALRGDMNSRHIAHLPNQVILPYGAYLPFPKIRRHISILRIADERPQGLDANRRVGLQVRERPERAAFACGSFPPDPVIFVTLCFTIGVHVSIS